MGKRRYLLTATTADAIVKTIGPTGLPFTHYWRIVAVLANGRTEVFWGHAKSLAEAKRHRAAADEAAVARGWRSYQLEIVALIRSEA